MISQHLCRRSNNNKWQLVLSLTLLLQLCCFDFILTRVAAAGDVNDVNDAAAAGDKKKRRRNRKDKKNKGPEYLFFNLPDGQHADPIIEYHTENVVDDPDQMPSFLDKSRRDHRVVLFYSPQCPHCIHFAPQYIQFAKYWNNITTQQQEDDNLSLYAGLEVKFYAVSCVTYKQVCRKQKVHSYPGVKIFSGNEGKGQVVTDVHGHELHPLTLIKGLGERLVKDEWQEDPNNNNKNQLQIWSSSDSSHFMPRRQEEIFGDAYLTFYHAMKDSIFLEDGPLPQQRGQAIKQWLNLLRKVLPPWRLNWMINEVLDDFAETAASERQWTALVEMYPPHQTEWSGACKQHKSPYTCGLWTFFHIVTVSVVEYNREIFDTGDHSLTRKAQNVHLVAVMLREYVHHFFLCEECSTHFVQAFDACEYNRCKRMPQRIAGDLSLAEWRELPLWLLEFHNGVNVRLLGEQFEREGRTKPPTVQEQQNVMWPSLEECPSCWITVAGLESEYDPEVMYEYLRMLYWPTDGATMNFQRQLKHDIAQYKANPSRKILASSQASRRQTQQGALTTTRVGSSMTGDPTTSNSPFMLVIVAVCGIWIVVLWRKMQMDHLLGIHRSKMRTM